MSAVPLKHPKKKRRIEQEAQPGPSSGARPTRPYLRPLGKRVFYSRRNSKSPSPEAYSLLPEEDGQTAKLSSDQSKEMLDLGLSANPVSPGFVKASSLLPEKDGQMVKLSRDQSKEISGLPANPVSPGFVKASEIRNSASRSSDEEDFQPAISSKHQRRKIPFSLNSGHSKEPQSPVTNNLLRNLKGPNPLQVRSDSLTFGDEDENVQGTKNSGEVGSKPVSFLPKEAINSACVLPNANAPSGSRSGFEISNCKKWRSRAPNKRRTNVQCNSSKITKYFLAANKINSAKTQKETKTKRTIISSTKPQKTRTDLGWDKKNEEFLETITDNEQFFKRFRDRYGLVENSMEEDEGEDYFCRLPTHIIELVLCTVPILDFMNCRLVCKRWMDIIDNPRFMKWKKLYYKYKKERKAVEMPRNHLAVDGCVETLVNFMGKEFSRLPSRDMHHLLLQNTHGELADHVLKERFPEWNGKDSRVWCQVCVAVLICESVWDVLGLYRSLMTGCLRTDLHDALYCFALFLFHFRCTENINCGLHYRVYYALYVIENSIPLSQRQKVQRIQNIPGQQNIQSYGESDGGGLTYEQIRILNHRFDLNQKIKIVALAGSGKTTTLVHLARLYPQIQFLNIVFNKSVNREAKRKFPPNVVCKTAHAIAYEAVGRELRHKLAAKLRPHDLIKYISHNEEKLHIYLYTRLVLATVCNFMYSGDGALALHHVPRVTPEDRTISAANRDRILLDAREVWQKMEEKTSEVRITHDVYLKLYQLSQPKLDQYQCIMVDEAQDCNPAILDIVMSQSVPVLLVGDPHQQIYAFRGVQNALQRSQATHTYSLTKSFRFGPEISYVASCVLEVSLNATENVLVGNTFDSNLRGESSGQFAVIARSNLVLFNEAVRMVVLQSLKPYEPYNIKPFFAGGLASYGFDQMIDIYTLKFASRGEKKHKDKFFCRFKSFHDLYEYAKLSNDKDLKSKIELVNQHGHNIPNFILHLRQKCTTSIQNASVVFTTAHKSKGLEFDTVSLTDDYVISPSNGEPTQEEANILYVAITRAKKCLFMPEKISKLLHAAHEKFEYPVSSKSLLKDRTELKCVQCEAVFVPHTVLTMVRRKIVMASNRVVTEGALCMKCRSDPTTRPDVHLNGLVMYLDPVPDNSHRVMNALAGPLPSDPPIVHDRFNEFANADRVFVINLNIH